MSEDRFQVLLVEDNPADARLVRLMLAEASTNGFEGRFNVRVTGRMSEALAALAEEQFHAVLLDLSLPDASGLEAIHMLRAAAPQLPIVVFSGMGDEEVAVQAVQEGAEDYLVKGMVEGPLLVRAIRYALERKKAEQTLRESESLKASILESALDCIITIDHRGRIIEFNPAAQSTFGYALDEVRGREMVDLIIPLALRDQHRLGLKRYVATGESKILGKRIELTGMRADGSEFPTELYIVRVTGSDPPIFTGFLRDITERKRAEDALREREQRLSSIYETAADVIFHLTVEGDGRYRFTSVNPAFLSVTGLRYDEIVRKLVNEVIPEPSLTLVLGKYDTAIREKRIVRWEETSDYPTGRLTGEVSVAPVFDDTGHCTNLVGAVHDITERKRAEEEIRKLNSDLERRVAERTNELEAANRELESFSYSISHDLRAPVRRMAAFAQILLADHADCLDEAAQNHLSRIQTMAYQMNEMIEGLLDLARLSRRDLQFSQLDLSAIAEKCAAELREQAPERTVEFVISPHIVGVGDARLFEVVLQNLLGNAWKYTLKQPEARIEFGILPEGALPSLDRTFVLPEKGGMEDEEHNRVVYFVRDNGAGFDPKYAQKLFVPFQRLHTPDEFPGLGIGLATVKRIIHRHGGRIWAEGDVEKGATFYFTLGG